MDTVNKTLKLFIQPLHSKQQMPNQTIEKDSTLVSPMISATEQSPLAAKEGAAECVPIWSANAGRAGKVKAVLAKLKSPQTVGLASLIGVITLWLGSSMLTQDILRSYNKPMLMTFISVISMQSYFVFLKMKDPLIVYMNSQKSGVRKYIKRTNSHTS